MIFVFYALNRVYMYSFVLQYVVFHLKHYFEDSSENPIHKRQSVTRNRNNKCQPGPNLSHKKIIVNPMRTLPTMKTNSVKTTQGEIGLRDPMKDFSVNKLDSTCTFFRFLNLKLFSQIACFERNL